MNVNVDRETLRDGLGKAAQSATRCERCSAIRSTATPARPRSSGISISGRRRNGYPGFGAYSLDFTLICRAASFVDPSLSQHELRKRILRRFREEGIEIPLPVRTVELHRRRPARRAAAELAGPAAGG